MTAEAPSPPPSSLPPLDGYRVLEVGELVSAPYAARLLGSLGAEVIKVELPHGDRARHRGPFAGDPDPNASGLFLALNTNKRSLVVDPTRGRAQLEALAADADIVITNVSPAARATLGLDLDRLRTVNPALVTCSVTPFGETGPYAGYQAEELTISHAGGWAYQCPGASAEIDEPPLKVFGHQTDFHAGTAAAMACVASAMAARATGHGDHIDMCAMAHTAGMLEAAFIAASYMGENPNRLGARLLNPWGIYECADGLMFLVTVEQDQWERLVAFMGHPEWTETGLFDTVELRHENTDLLTVYLGEWLAEQKVDDLWQAGQAERICFAPVFTMADLAGQEHLHEREFFVDVDHDGVGPITHLGPPYRASPSPWCPPTSAPTLDPEAAPTFSPRSTTDPTPAAQPRRARPLEGVRVLDLSWVWAGPYGAMHLGYLGAEVIKVESAERPGLGRRLPLHPPEMEPSLNTSAYFNQWEQGKQSCLLDLSHPEAVEVVKQLAATSDVVIENFATGVMERLGLGYEQLKAVKPDLIVASISGYGEDGPLASYMGYGPTTGPLTGLSSLTGYRDGPPLELGVSIGDPAAGITAAFAVVAALSGRDRHGQGCHIDVALWEATASFAVEGWMTEAMTGHQPPRMGNRDPLMAPHNCYRTADDVAADGRAPGQAPASNDEVDPGQWISIACRDDASWAALADLIDPGLADDPRFATAADRKSNEDDLDQIVGAWTARHDRWSLTARLQEAGVAAFPSMSPMDLLHDRHLDARGALERQHHAEVGRRVHTGMSWRVSDGDNGVTGPAPLIGEHTEHVLSTVLGFDAATVARLAADGVCR